MDSSSFCPVIGHVISYAAPSCINGFEGDGEVVSRIPSAHQTLVSRSHSFNFPASLRLSGTCSPEPLSDPNLAFPCLPYNTASIHPPNTHSSEGDQGHLLNRTSTPQLHRRPFLLLARSDLGNPSKGAWGRHTFAV